MGQSLQQNNKRLVKRLVLAVVLMFGFAFALVPLYNVLCDLTGLNGRTSGEASVASTTVDAEREVTVQFVTSIKPDMPWQFGPQVRSIKVHPGQIQQVNFFAENKSPLNITGQAIPSVTPGKAAAYFKKTECFCFNEQVLTAGEKVDMPLVFYIDPALPEKVSTITLSYTLFNISDQITANEQLAQLSLPAAESK